MTMYKLTLALFASFSLILPVFGLPRPVHEVEGLEKRDTFSGRGTFYEPSVGACGQTNNANQLVVAISAAIFNNGALCGQQVQINSGGASVTAQIVDSCAACGPDDLDMSPAAFQTLAPTSVGAIPITWEYV